VSRLLDNDLPVLGFHKVGGSGATSDRKVRINLLQARAACLKLATEALDASCNTSLTLGNASLDTLGTLKCSWNAAVGWRRRRRRARRRRARASAICADADTLDGLASGSTALSITGTKGSLIGRWGADKCTLLVVTSRGLQCALRSCSGASRNIGRASGRSAVWGAELACEALDLDSFLVSETAISWVAIVGLATWWSRRAWWSRWAWRTWWCWWARWRSRTHLWVRWLHGDTTLARLRCDVTGKVDVSSLSPCSTPRVFHLPIGFATISAITDNEDTMVKLGTTCAREDTTFVELESRLICFNGDRDRLLLHGGLKLGFVVLGHIGVTSDFDCRIGGLGGGAGAGLSSVRVGRLEDIAFGLNVLEAIVHKTTIAALVSIGTGTRDELLLREGGELTSGDRVNSLDGAGGGESPA
jgi:hypothetical protein